MDCGLGLAGGQVNASSAASREVLPSDSDQLYTASPACEEENRPRRGGEEEQQDLPQLPHLQAAQEVRAEEVAEEEEGQEERQPPALAEEEEGQEERQLPEHHRRQTA